MHVRLGLFGSIAWSVAIAAIALYERHVADPWHMFGEDAGLLFYRRSSRLIYSEISPFGDCVLELQVLRFAEFLLLPVALLWLTGVLRIRRRRPLDEAETGHQQF